MKSSFASCPVLAAAIFTALAAAGGAAPAEVSARLSEQFLSTSPDAYRPEGCTGKAYGGGEYIHYSVVSLWVNALECARLNGDTNLVNRLVAAFEPAYADKRGWMNGCRHVDLSIVGAIPLEIAILTGDARAKELGLMYAERQWEEPREGLDWGERWYDPIPLAERHANWEKGYSPETRLWIDDMYMITFLQSQAYRLTGERKYIDRAAKEMCMYLEKLQRADGLFNHAPGAPFAWGRGNGWMAAAMAMNLKHLPADSEWREPILAGFRKMMAALLKRQRPDGLWGQIVDDGESYDETSASAMFAYAFAEGAKAGAVGGEYMDAAKRAYAALVARLDGRGNLADVCVGTGWRNDRNHYLTRPKANGDPHGQAPLLWLCRELIKQVRPVLSIQERIDEIAAAGGGTLTLCAGVYRTGALFFKPGVNLHLEKGATIIGVDDAEGYPVRETRIEGETCVYYPALINADGCNGFTISGEGVIDGHGLPTWKEFWKRRAEARKNGGDFANKSLMRPRILYVSNSKNVDVSGVTFRNSKFWTTHYYRCENVRVHDCTIEAEVIDGVRGPSTDAIDIDVCRHFTVSNVVMNVNDDAVAIKGGKGPWADDYSKCPGNGPSEDVLVADCTFKSVCHSCLTLGSECPAATNIVLRGAKLEGPGNLLNLKMRSDTPQHYAKILVEDCEGECNTFLNVMRWSQYHDAKGRPENELKSYADGVVMRNNKVSVGKMKRIAPSGGAYELKGLVLEANEIAEKGG